MPYTKDNPPEQIKELPAHAQEIWISAYNSAYEQYDKDEAKASATAWDAVKKSYKQDDEGNWVKLEEDMETIDINGVEILAAGTWRGTPETKTYSRKDLDEVAKSFKELTDNKQLNYEPPIKLGHDDSQKLLQKDGYPAAGWISSLKRAGDKLVANIKGVPKKIGDIVKAGGYKKVSSEIYHEYEIGGKKYPLVLKAVSFLGGDIPAVKTLQDIVAQYGDSREEQLNIVIYEMGESLDARTNQVREAFRQAQQRPIGQEIYTWAKEIYEDSIIAETPEGLFRIPYRTDEQGVIAFDFDKQVKVEITYTPVPETENTENKNKEEIMIEKLKEMYGLPEDATEEQVLEAARGNKEKADSSETKFTETQSLTEKVKTLETKLSESEKKVALKERDENVSAAINTGKILPAQKEWAEQYAFADPSGFRAFVESQPVIVKLGEEGTSKEETVELTETEVSIGEKLEVSKEDLIAVKKTESK